MTTRDELPEFCEPFDVCEALDGRLLISRTIDGPPLATSDDLAMGGFGLDGAMLRPYVRLGFEQKWIPKEMCYGPVRSILGLAPGEEIVTDVRTAESTEFTSLVQTAMESSVVSTNTRLEGREFVDTNWDGETVDLSKITVGEWGSWWEIGGAVVGGLLGGPIGAGIGAWVGGAIGDALSGGGGGPAPDSATGKIVSVIEESLETVQRSQSSHILTETSSRISRSRERSITRTFRNPYIDRTLELRFIPTFRRFEVVTTILTFEYGLSLDVGKVRFPSVGVGLTHGDFLAARLTDQRMMSVANAELGVEDEFSTSAAASRAASVSDHLNANSELYSKKMLRHMHANRDLETLRAPVQQVIRGKVESDDEATEIAKAFQWSSAYAKDTSVFVPATAPELAVPKLGLTEEQATDFRGKLDSVAGGVVNVEVSTKDVHLFAGTHVEAAPGRCRLPGLRDRDPDEADGPDRPDRPGRPRDDR